MDSLITIYCRVGTANKILAAKEKEREKDVKGKGKETARKKAKRYAIFAFHVDCHGLRHPL